MGCAGSKEGAAPNPEVKNPIATFNTTMGTIMVELYLDRVRSSCSPSFYY